MSFCKDIRDTIKIFFVLLIDPLVRIFLFLWPTSRKSIKGEIVLLTGAGHGLGKELAKRLATKGAILVLWDINQEWNDHVASELRQQGCQAHSYRVDVTNEREVAEVAARVKSEVGDVSILINNAGVFSGHRVCQLPAATIRRCFEVNSMAHFWLIQQFLPRMMELNKGHIVAVASMAGRQGIAYMTDYCASKYAAVGLMESLFMELQFENKYNIKLTTICPVIINTGLISNVRTRFPMLLPLLKVERAADVILDSILKEKDVVCIPTKSYYLDLFKRFFRRKTQFQIMAYTGYGFDFEPPNPPTKKAAADIV